MRGRTALIRTNPATCVPLPKPHIDTGRLPRARRYSHRAVFAVQPRQRSAVYNGMDSTLHAPAPLLRQLLALQGPSLGLWRAAEIAVLRQHDYIRPVLDLGCGDGLVTGLVLPHIEIGVDPYRPALTQAAARGVYGRLIDRPLEAAPLAAGSVGTIVSNSVLEHVARPERVMRAAARLLRPGGRLVFTVPTEAFSQWLMLPTARYARWRNRHYEHHNLWPIEHWREMLDGAGFSIERVRSYLPQRLVTAWDVLELAQRVWVGPHRVFGVVWRRLPARALAHLADWAARIDLGAPPPGGGRLIVARRR